METIPRPDRLDPHRVDRDDRDDMTVDEHRARWQRHARALDETCEYATRLWEELHAVRQYLVASLPTPLADPGSHRIGTRPTGPDDITGWERWLRTYVGVVAALEGQRGDSGFARIEAQQEMQARRRGNDRNHASA